MGNKALGTSDWTMEDWAFGTAQNAVTMEEVVAETSKMPAKYFGGEAIQKDESMLSLQQDLLLFDDKIKSLFRRIRRKKHDKNHKSEIYTEPNNSTEDSNYLQPTPVDGKISVISGNQHTQTGNNNVIPPKLAWRCINCMTENKTTEHTCRKCGQGATRF